MVGYLPALEFGQVLGEQGVLDAPCRPQFLLDRVVEGLQLLVGCLQVLAVMLGLVRLRTTSKVIPKISKLISRPLASTKEAGFSRPPLRRPEA